MIAFALVGRCHAIGEMAKTKLVRKICGVGGRGGGWFVGVGVGVGMGVGGIYKQSSFKF